MIQSNAVPSLSRDLHFFAIALGFRVVVMLSLWNFEHVEPFETAILVPNLLEGRGLVYPWFGSSIPISNYPIPYLLLVTASLGLFGGSALGLELLQCFIGAAVVWPVLFLGRHFFSDRSARWAAVAVALHPVQAYYACRTQAVVLDTFLVATTLALILWSAKGGTWRRAAAAGACAGVLLMSRFQYAPYLLALTGWLVLETRGNRPERKLVLRRAMVAAAVGLLVMSPWIVRNAVVHQRFIPGASGFGYQLWVGNNPQATGAVIAADGQNVNQHIPPPALARMKALTTEAARDEVLRNLAVEHIVENPGTVAALIPRKILYLWWFDPYLPTSFPVLRVVVYLPLLLGFGLGALLLRRRWRELFPLWGLFALITVAYAIFFATARFRYLLEPEMLLVAFGGVETLVGKHTKPVLGRGDGVSQ